LTKAVRLILASASPARLKTLRGAGVEPEVIVSHVPEDEILADAEAQYGPLDPPDAALLLARAKAEAVAASVDRDFDGEFFAALDDEDEAASPDPETANFIELSQPEPEPEVADAIVLGCDSIFELDGTKYGKPEDPVQARARLRQMSGRTGVLHTGHWIVDLRDSDHGGTGATLGATSSAKVTVADLDDDEIAAYVATGEPLHVAGSFTIDGLGGPYIERIEGDPHGVVGVSLPLVRELLEKIGVPWRTLRT